MTNRNGCRHRCSRWAVAAGLVFVAWTAAARADTYLIISLIGDHLTIVTPMQSVASHADPNRYETVPLGGTELTTSPYGPPVPWSARYVRPTRSKCCARSIRPCAR